MAAATTLSPPTVLRSARLTRSRRYFAFLDLWPKDANRAVVHQWATGPGQESLKVMDLTTGRLTPLLDSRVGLGWAWGHPSPLWLSDGRLVFSTPAKAMGGPACIRDMLLSEFRVEFPPFREVQPVMPPGGK